MLMLLLMMLLVFFKGCRVLLVAGRGKAWLERIDVTVGVVYG